MSENELLEMTGNVWLVRCFKGWERADALRTVFVRAASKAKAEAVGKAVTGLRHAAAYPWNPLADPVMRPFIRKAPA